MGDKGRFASDWVTGYGFKLKLTRIRFRERFEPATHARKTRDRQRVPQKPNSMKHLLHYLTLGACFLSAFLPAHAGESPPNVVLILADDLGYGDLGCYGATKVKTPRIDSLAAAGRKFTDAHSASAVCSPSRCSLLTGSYPLRKNFWGPTPTPTQKLTIDTDTLTLPGLLKEVGYATACIGKWHLGLGDPRPDWNGDLKPGPLELGFDYYFGNPGVNSSPPFVYVENHRVVGLDPGDPLVAGKTAVSRRFPEKDGYDQFGGAEAAHRLYDDEQVGTTLKEKSIAWLKKQPKDQPFFLYLATTNIHHPFTPAPQFVGTSDCGLYGDFIHELDWMVGGVLDTLEEMGVADNTLVIFTSDNGGMLNETAQKAWKAGHRLNGDLQGFKFGAWEGGHRVPFIARWPAKIPAGTISGQLLNLVDLVATMAAITGRELKQGEGIDSINQLESLTGEPAKPVRETMVITPNSPKHLGLRKGKWVYIPAQGAGGFQGGKAGEHGFSDAAALPFTGSTHNDYENGRIRPDAPPAQLYDLEADPRQKRNVFAENPAVVRELESELAPYRQAIPATKPVGWINLKQ
jgi:arylsulfatase A